MQSTPANSELHGIHTDHFVPSSRFQCILLRLIRIPQYPDGLPGPSVSGWSMRIKWDKINILNYQRKNQIICKLVRQFFGFKNLYIFSYLIEFLVQNKRSNQAKRNDKWKQECLDELDIMAKLADADT